MPGIWSVLAAAVGLLFVAAPSGVLLRFVAPQEDAVLLGPTEFTFAVDDPEVDRVDVYVGGRLIGSATPPEWTLTWDAPSSATGAAVVAVAYKASQMVDKVRRETTALAFSGEIDVTTVQLYPAVRDRRGRYVSDLTPADFQVLESGRAVELDAFASSASSLTIVFLLDVSASMEQDLSVVRDAAAHLVDQLGVDDQVALYAFHQAISVAVPPSLDRAGVKKRLFELKAGGGTALFDSVMRVLSDLEPVAGRKAIVVFSDGLDERSVTSLTRTVEAARRSEVLLYTIGTAHRQGDAAAREDLRQLADDTGGESFLVEKIRQLPEVFASILADLRAQYVLSFTPRPGPKGWRRVEVSVRNRGVDVRCRDSYYYDG